MRMRTQDSTLAYYVNQLDNLDKRLYEPLYNVTWGRDIELRTGITLANESTSFIQSTIGASGTLTAAKKPWVSSNTNTLMGVSVDGQRIVTPLRPLAMEVSYTTFDLERSQLLGQPIDVQQFEGLNIKYQMSTDEMVYIGDTDLNVFGLLNNPNVTVGPVANGQSGFPEWTKKTPDEILFDVNTLINSVWAASGYAVCPKKLLLAPNSFMYLNSTRIGTAGQFSILEFLKQNSLSLSVNGTELDIQPVKWLAGRGVGGTNRMVAYSDQERFVRFPMVPIRRETPYYNALRFSAPYVWGLGEVEFVYPETLGYADGM